MHYARAIREEISRALESPDVIFLGEDIREYGGAFGVSRGLWTEYPEQVINTPLSEPALMGVATGMALGGMHPILEIMFMDFMTLTIDQLLNHALKYEYMYNGKLHVPLLIRTPYGDPEAGYGPTHSQTLISLMATFPGLQIMAPADVGDVREMFRAAMTATSPVLFLEGKSLYWKKFPDHVKSLGTHAEVSTVPLISTKLTVATYGELVHTVLQLREEHNWPIDVVNLRYIKPLDMQAIKDSVFETGRLLVIDQCAPFCSIASEITSQIPGEKLTAADSPIPCARSLVEHVCVTKEKIQTKIEHMLQEEK